MSYEYEEQLTELAADYLDTGNHEPIIEVTEVYAKAQAYDDIMKLLNKHTIFIEDYHTNWECFGEEMIDLGLNDL
ncbi:hypothetical protein LNK15_03160 [Jeotgalicoccus huakuii]|nr:hypothetical protein [Jeotgalicoccus huakuii]